jgi:hypothetical protein
MFKAFKGASENLVKRLDETRSKMTPRQRYNKDFQTRVSWMDFSVIKVKGRAFDADRALIPKDEAEVFPGVNGFDLNGDRTAMPHSITANAKFVGFSCSQLGQKFVSSWLNPFHEKFGTHKKVLFDYVTKSLVSLLCILHSG